VSPRAWLTLRAVALVGAGALAVHELRYALAFSGHGEAEQASSGHAYLAVLAPLALVALAVAAALGVRALARRPGRTATGPRFTRAWAAASVALAAVYSAQELAEGALAPGHASGLAALVGDGGWIAFPLALAIGALVAAALRGTQEAARVVAAVAAAVRARLPLAPRVLGAARADLVVAVLATDALARHRAGRAPPARVA
jgi:hypothetical protein